jgi:hypothetical protein
MRVDPNKYYADGTLIMDPTQVIQPSYDSIDTLTSGNGFLSQLTTANHTIRDPYADLYARLNKLELNEKLLRLKILSLEGKFDKDEVANIRKMLMSEDEGSRTLADSIIENA